MDPVSPSPTPSPGALLAWKIAAVEAQYLDADCIRPEHLFLGLMSLDKMLKRRNPGADSRGMAGVMEEWNAISVLLGIAGHDPVVLRRILRATLPRGNAPDNRTIIHRCPETLAYFERAGRLAGTRPLTANDLFSAIMEQPGEMIPEILAEGRSCIAAERETDVPLPPATRLMAAGRISGQAAADRSVLNRYVGRYRDTLVQWRPGSAEYSATRDAINRTAAALARLHLGQGDLSGLVSAFRQVVPGPGGFSEACTGLIPEIERAAAEDRPLTGDLLERVRRCIAALESRDPEENGTR